MLTVISELPDASYCVLRSIVNDNSIKSLFFCTVTLNILEIVPFAWAQYVSHWGVGEQSYAYILHIVDDFVMIRSGT